MDAADFTRLLTAAATPMGLPQGTVERASDGFRRLTFEFLKCDVLRDWFNEDFLRARYWRLADGELLSDGGGGGRLPGFPTSLLFIRNAEMEFEGALTARFDPAAGEHLPIRTLRVASMQPAPSHLKTDQALAVARKLHLPLAAAMLTSAPLQHAGNSNEETIVVSAAARVAAITRETHAPLRETRQITVRDHRHQQSSPGQVRPQPGTTPVHVTIESSGPPINGIVVDVASAGSATRRAVLAGDESTVTGTVHVAGAPTGKPVPLLVTVSDTNRPLDQQTIKLGNQPVELRWRIEAEPIRITLTPATTPTLFGYLVRPVPRCPDPDEQLPWR